MDNARLRPRDPRPRGEAPREAYLENRPASPDLRPVRSRRNEFFFIFDNGHWSKLRQGTAVRTKWIVPMKPSLTREDYEAGPIKGEGIGPGVKGGYFSRGRPWDAAARQSAPPPWYDACRKWAVKFEGTTQTRVGPPGQGESTRRRRITPHEGRPYEVPRFLKIGPSRLWRMSYGKTLKTFHAEAQCVGDNGSVKMHYARCISRCRRIGKALFFAGRRIRRPLGISAFITFDGGHHQAKCAGSQSIMPFTNGPGTK